MKRTIWLCIVGRKANSPQAILDTLGDMAGMFHNNIKEMSNVMDVTD